MNKKIIKNILIILLIVSVLFLITTPVFATQTGDGIKTQADNWLNKGAANNPISAEKIGSILRPVANILLAIGSVIIVIMGVVMGIKYITASPDKQGQLKGQLVGLFVSAVVLYGAYGIWSVVYTVLKGIIG